MTIEELRKDLNRALRDDVPYLGSFLRKLLDKLAEMEKKIDNRGDRN
jgi:hypothetical protein